MTRNDFNKDEKPRKPRIQSKKVEELEEKLNTQEKDFAFVKECYVKHVEEIQKEAELTKESYAKEIDRLKLSVSDHEKTIKAQASEITKLTGSNKAYESEIETMAKYITALKERSLLERIINKDVAL